MVSDEKNTKPSSLPSRFQSALRFAVVSDGCTSPSPPCPKFQSALRFAVVSDPTPWHAVPTSPVAAVLHTTLPHLLQQADRTCPQRGKTPSQVPYTPEAVFGRSPTPLSEGVSKTPGCGQPGLPASFNPTLMPPPGPPCQASTDPAGFFTSPRSAAPGPVDGPDPGSGLPPSRPRTASRSTASPCFRR